MNSKLLLILSLCCIFFCSCKGKTDSTRKTAFLNTSFLMDLIYKEATLMPIRFFVTLCQCVSVI